MNFIETVVPSNLSHNSVGRLLTLLWIQFIAIVVNQIHFNVEFRLLFLKVPHIPSTLWCTWHNDFFQSNNRINLRRIGQFSLCYVPLLGCLNGNCVPLRTNIFSRLNVAVPWVLLTEVIRQSSCPPHLGIVDYLLQPFSVYTSSMCLLHQKLLCRQLEHLKED